MKQPFDTPALLSTQVNLIITADGWRLSFGEPVSTDATNYHSSVFLPTTTAHQLIDLMNSKRQQAN